MTWFVVRTKTLAESQAVMHLRNQGFDVYLLSWGDTGFKDRQCQLLSDNQLLIHIEIIVYGDQIIFVGVPVNFFCDFCQTVALLYFIPAGNSRRQFVLDVFQGLGMIGIVSQCS